ncbi:MAG: type 1 glutamine amidotransferase [Thiobacillus sp.]
MNPVLIIRHAATEDAGYFSTFLDRAGIPWKQIAIDANDLLPAKLNDISGLCLMGGSMSVNDDFPWITHELDLIRQAVDADVPVIGHCLGGQLLAKALGGVVTRNPVKEIGWADVQITDTSAARPWLGNTIEPMLAFHWHGETFSLPPGATRLLQSVHCANQAFIVSDRHLGMQCHVEMTPELVRSWCLHGADEIAASDSPAVQTPEDIQTDLKNRTDALHALADKIYSRWIQGLRL